MDKGKQIEHSKRSNNDGDSSNSRRGVALGLGEELRSMVQGQQKAPGSAQTGSHLQEAMQDMSMQDASTSRNEPFRQRALRSRTPTSLENEYAKFQRVPDNVSKPIFTDQIQTPSANTEFMEKAWNSSVLAQPTSNSQPSAPAKPQNQPANDLNSDSENFFAALDKAEAEQDTNTRLDERVNLPLESSVPHGISLTRSWRPPSPSDGPTITEEQHRMHERLAKRQVGLDEQHSFRQAESYIPPADDATLNEGVYAATPQEALQSIWDAQNTREAHVRQFRADEATKPVSGPSYTQIRGQEIVDKLRGWIVRQGYIEDVYGLPPLVAQTFGEAMDEGKTEEQEERRAKAIRRLDALYRHLSAPSYDSSSDSTTIPATQKMENWLQNHQS
ncbi:hypothetical protein MYAM1_003049 [Malassezia yamatoensis]|uniref:Uncharacterized protein n=1 Tax=Malassezia yamatoensis TaxID=253288 RepID=A0AAJ6CII8_9BASI|nr:hypothetical protein MYAM1_003049 [Malassezia yamatoensis]